MSNEPLLPDLIASNVVIVAGKGGVGKTTVTAVLARAAHDAGQRVLVVELDGKSTLDELVPDLPVQHLSAPDALADYLDEHGFKRIAKRLSSTGVIEVIGTAAPGVDDLVVLGKIKQLERSGDWDLIVVDGPAAGHAITFLTSPAGLLDAVRSGPIRSQATDVLAMLGDAERCQVALVTVPETTPVNELIETAFAVEDRVGVQLAPIVVNQIDPATALPDPDTEPTDAGAEWSGDARAAAAYRRERLSAQGAEIRRLAVEVPLDQAHLPAVAAAGLSSGRIAELADRLRTGAP